MKTAIIIICCLFLFSGIASGEIYKWVDEKGTVYFTEDPATIPEKYRSKAESRTTEEDHMTPEERLREQRRNEEDVWRRQAKQEAEYQKSLAGERIRKQTKEEEETKREERVRVEKEERVRKPKESVKESVPGREPQKQTLVKCQHCQGGYVSCRFCNGEGGRRDRTVIRGPQGGRWSWVWNSCHYCGGTGRRECSACGGKGVFLR